MQSAFKGAENYTLKLQSMENLSLKRRPQSSGIINENRLITGHKTVEPLYNGHWKIAAGSGQITLCPFASAILGLGEAKSLVLRNIYRLLDPADLPRLKEWIRITGKSKIIEPFQVCIRTAQQVIKWFKISGIHCLNNWGLAEMVLGTIEDVTHSVNEERIALSIVNHELRNPLSVIRLYAQLLEKEHLNVISHAKHSFASAILTHVDGITGLLDHYLSDNSDNGKIQQLNLSVFSLDQLIDQTIGDLSHLHADRILSRTPSLPVFIQADRYLIMQVLVNYLSNALKHSPEYSRINIQIVQANGEVSVGVADEGKVYQEGLKAEYLTVSTRSGIMATKKRAKDLAYTYQSKL
jgi:two-component system sensor histidine kinase VicK